VFAVVFFHHALVAEAQVHFATVRAADRVIIVRAFPRAFVGGRSRGRLAGRRARRPASRRFGRRAGWRASRCRAGRLQLVTDTGLLVAGWTAGHHQYGRRYRAYGWTTQRNG